MKSFTLTFLLLALFHFPVFGQAVDYFVKFRGELPVKVFYGVKPRPVSLLGVDSTKGIIYAKMEGAGSVEFQLRGLKQQNINRFEYEWPNTPRQALQYLSNEQYSPRVLEALRPIVYKLLLFLDIPYEFMQIHDSCLIYTKALVQMNELTEAFYILSRLNLAKLDEQGFREFSELALELAGKMILSNSKSAKSARALLQKVSIRNDSADHAAYLRLADSLRRQGLYSEAISEYSRLGPIVQQSLNSPYRDVLKLWPIYCYIKLYESYSKAAAQDKRYAQAASRMFNTALQTIKEIDEKPPKRQSNEFSLYKLIRALIRVQYARQFEAAGNAVKSADFYRQSVLEVTEGIVTARVGLDWLPESLIMAADAYENLKMNEAAANVYKQVIVFFKDSKWAQLSQQKLGALPPS
ncbi:MAG: hypothetical protein VX609_05770 [Verrucomicrobiota bacterium]|nr:hypothetical protein [Verrucomicrobiota bacterium]